MSAQTPLHDWLRPRLEQMLQDAAAAGFARDAAATIVADIAMQIAAAGEALPEEPVMRPGEAPAGAPPPSAMVADIDTPLEEKVGWPIQPDPLEY